eukprot:6485016-Alexandrium_andersonii.AAC.1
MSASLVGSEMCIRDRARRAPAAFTTQHSKSGTLCVATTLRALATTWTWICLLYTSDAADDM